MWNITQKAGKSCILNTRTYLPVWKLYSESAICFLAHMAGVRLVCPWTVYIGCMTLIKSQACFLFPSIRVQKIASPSWTGKGLSVMEDFSQGCHWIFWEIFISGKNCCSHQFHGVLIPKERPQFCIWKAFLSGTSNLGAYCVNIYMYNEHLCSTVVIPYYCSLILIWDLFDVVFFHASSIVFFIVVAYK